MHPARRPNTMKNKFLYACNEEIALRYNMWNSRLILLPDPERSYYIFFLLPARKEVQRKYGESNIEEISYV
jgi:hypothetical protein